ncbi:hypothetical protein NQ156_06615 [Microbacterium sp. zg.Y625]|uniref:hypothetical protein n=1 Tax=Microbacterium jiangjiandongii TaxID=3049071 RepID=UPI00214BB92D|nr:MULTISPECIES: hypothetical protein [unclassified Microbacterium]MCR2792734.1 hypothetical protein [Microbacterium sp. zg.Y625]WIM26711.1 hypothetical protein QNO14_06640 [Microbacterium sp. zg-Y625]
MDDHEKLRRFVLRARRVQAHSIVQNWDELLRHAQGSFDGHIDVTGRMTITRRLPADEEVFESLASRVRPLTVKSEPVYYVKVFDAIEHLIREADVDDVLRARLQELRRAWDASEIQGTQVQAYSVQSARIDGSDATNKVSDTQLAAAWLYADLVHADAQGPKQDALAFSLRERYAAAVRVFSHMAALTVATLRIVESLRDAQVLALDDSAWQNDVTIGTSELIEEARAYVAPVGSEVPDMRDSLELTEDWSAFTVTELLRQDPTNHVRVVLRDGNGEITEAHDAAVARRRPDTSVAEWDVLVAGSVMFKFSFDIQGERMTDAHFRGWEAFDSTNGLKLASTRFMLQFHRSTAVAFEVGGSELLSLGPPAISDIEQRELEVIAETVKDIVRIERLSGQTVEPCNGRFDDRDRVRLRRARLLMEGQIVHAMRHPVTVTAPEGKPPQVVVIAAGTLDVGGAEVPTPQTVMRHPAMTAAETGLAPETGPAAKTYRMEPPPGEQFLAWVPGLAEVSGDEDLLVTASWELIGIDEERFSG